MNNTDFLRQLSPHIASSFELIFEGEVVPRALAPTEHTLILLGLFAVHGDEEDVRTRGRQALREGVTPDAVLEVVLAASLSRGVRAISMARSFLAELEFTPSTGDNIKYTDVQSYLQQEFGEIPHWAANLAEFSPTFLKAYATVRENVLCEGAARRRTKELLTMALNAIDGSGGGVVAHATAALRHGAEPAHLIEVLLLSIRVGGIIAWINGIEAIRHLVLSSSDRLPSDGLDNSQGNG